MLLDNGSSNSNSSCSDYNRNFAIIVENPMIKDAKTTERRLQTVEDMVSKVGNHLTKINWNASDEQAALIFKMFSHKKSLKHKRDDSEKNSTRSFETSIVVRAMKYWKCQYRLYPILDINTLSGKFMERIYKGYFTMFDPYQSWLSPSQFFDSVVVNRTDNFLGMAIILLILRIQILSQNNKCTQTNNFYNQFSQLTQSRVPEIYSAHSYSNVLALLFMSIQSMSFGDKIEFFRYFSSAARMASVLDLKTTYNMSIYLPDSHPDKHKYKWENFIGKSVYYLDSLISTIMNQPRQLKDTVYWGQCASSSEIVKYVKKTPFLSIPLNPPRLISSFSTIIPGFEEISTLNYYIIDRFRLMRIEYSYLPSYKLIPVQKIFFNHSDYQILNQLSKSIQNKLINLYTIDLIKEYLENNEYRKNLEALIERIIYALGLIITYNYPHILLYPQPAYIPPSHISKVVKFVENISEVCSDFFKLANEQEKKTPPFNLDYIWRALLACLNISVQMPTDRTFKLIKNFVKLITDNYSDEKGKYKKSDLSEYFNRYCYNLENYLDS
jgi:hypothetical protein